MTKDMIATILAAVEANKQRTIKKIVKRLNEYTPLEIQFFGKIIGICYGPRQGAIARKALHALGKK